ncbi:extracellular solute-binding protein [Patescibacteria group bacterium]|nr:extracellular solute-binding protein [Patescibacteria group bacterium]
MNKGIFILGAVVVIVLIGVLMWTGCKHPETIPSEKLTKKTLTFWGVWDDSEDFEEVIRDFHAEYSNITIEYRKLKAEEYEEALLRAWAAGEGPDIFMVHNSWVQEYQRFLAPMPESVDMARFSVTKNLFGKEEIKVALQSIDFPQAVEIDDYFVDVVADDAIIDNQVYGLPLSVDTLALYYNKDLLAAEGVVFPPTVWQEFASNADSLVPRLTKTDESGRIIQAGAAMGTSSNIDRSIDILSLLMMQNGTVMINEASNKVSFADEINKIVLGESALEYYTDFANPATEAYSWNDSMTDALELFIQGQLAFMFGYSYHLDSIEQRGARLNYDVAPMLHINPDGTDNNPNGVGSKAINYANYWLLGGYKESDYIDEAWIFIQTAAMGKDRDNKYIASKYLNQTNKPAALLELVSLQQDDPLLGVFATQAISAASWYTGYDAVATEEYLGDMIDNVVSGKSTPLQAIRLAADQVQKTLSTK